jgi:TPR repeat protein
MYDIRWEREPDVEEYRRLYSLSKSHPEKALIGLEALAERGSVASMLFLAWEYRAGGASRSKDLHKAKYWLGKADEAGSAAASYMLGVVCSQLSENDEAFAAFSRGAARDYLPAIYRQAIMYREGLGTPQDINRCRILLEVAASRGHLVAKRDLATIFIRGGYGPILVMRGILMLFNLFFGLMVLLARGVRHGEAVLLDERVLA